MAHSSVRKGFFSNFVYILIMQIYKFSLTNDQYSSWIKRIKKYVRVFGGVLVGMSSGMCSDGDATV